MGVNEKNVHDEKSIFHGTPDSQTTTADTLPGLAPASKTTTPCRSHQPPMPLTQIFHRPIDEPKPRPLTHQSHATKQKSRTNPTNRAQPNNACIPHHHTHVHCVKAASTNERRTHFVTRNAQNDATTAIPNRRIASAKRRRGTHETPATTTLRAEPDASYPTVTENKIAQRKDCKQPQHRVHRC